MSAEDNCPETGEFAWNELLAADLPAAKKFYTGLFGWDAESFPANPDYTIFKLGGTMVGGLMKCPQPGLPSHWLAYVTVDDVDAKVALARKLGAQIAMEPFEVPTVGRIAVLVDPQGAAIGLFKPAMG